MCARCDPRRLLAGRGLRATANRLAILDALLDAGEALSPPALLAAVRSKRPLDKVTLYRTLDTLHEAGLLTRHEAGDGSVRYCPAGPHHPEHHHFYCLNCHRLLCLEPQDVALDADIPPGADLTHVHIRLDGHCPRCRT